jgi:hypothetical protein
MASFFRNAIIKNIGKVPVEAIATAANSRTTIIGFSLANLTDGVVMIDIQLKDDTSVTAYYAKGLVLPPNSSMRVVNGGEKLIMSTSNTLYINSNLDDSVDAIISYVELI